MKVKYMYLMEMVITQFWQRVDYLTIEWGGPYTLVRMQWIRIGQIHHIRLSFRPIITTLAGWILQALSDSSLICRI